IAGSLTLYRKLTPLRVEFSLENLDSPQKLEREGVEAHLDSAAWKGKTLTGTARIGWPERLEVVARGISRNIFPYVVDERGRVYRDFSPKPARPRDTPA